MCVYVVVVFKYINIFMLLLQNYVVFFINTKVVQMFSYNVITQ